MASPVQHGLPAPETWETAWHFFRPPEDEIRAVDASRSRARSGKSVCRTGGTREALYRPMVSGRHWRRNVWRCPVLGTPSGFITWFDHFDLLQTARDWATWFCAL